MLNILKKISFKFLLIVGSSLCIFSTYAQSKPIGQCTNLPGYWEGRGSLKTSSNVVCEYKSVAKVYPFALASARTIADVTIESMTMDPVCPQFSSDIIEVLCDGEKEKLLLRNDHMQVYGSLYNNYAILKGSISSTPFDLVIVKLASQ
jgi:hypothetical protein